MPSCIQYFPSFFFHYSLPLRHPHSFPTRRSSDLADPPEGPAGDANGDGVRNSSQDEFVEILNRSSAPIDISGFKKLVLRRDRKSTRLNSTHRTISYAVFCLKKKKINKKKIIRKYK